MTVGNAEQLVSTVRVTDDAPYLFRTSGGAADIGNREYDKIVGADVAHNQLNNNSGTGATQNNVTYTNNGDGSWSVITTNEGASATTTRTVETVSFSKGHKYYLKGCPAGSNGELYCRDALSQRYPLSSDTGNGAIFNVTDNEQGSIRIRVENGTVISSAIKFYPQLFDLTAMFGSTIANHIYTLETAEAGSGIAWLKRYGFFTKPYYSYNAGVFASVAATAHETVEFNQWDEEWEQGAINNDGTTSLSTVMIRSKNFSPCLPGKEYCFTKPANVFFQIFWYDANQAFIKRNYFTVNAYALYTAPENAASFKVTIGSNEGPITAYANNICVNISWSGYRNGEYRPYVKHTYPLDDSVILHGRLVLDADGGLHYEGDTYAADGTVERNYGVVDLGTLTWTYFTADNDEDYFVCDVQEVMKPPATDDDVAAIFPSDLLTPVSGTTMYDTYPDKAIALQAMDGTITQGYLWVRWSSLSDPADLVAALSGVSLVYELATPTTEEAEPYQSPQIVNDFGTERYVVTAQDGFEMPVGHITEYPANLRDKLQSLPDRSADGDGSYAIQQSGTQMTLVPLASAVPNVYDLLDSNPIAHRTIYRGKYLGETITPAQKAAIADGSFHDIWLGDYWGTTAKLTIVDFDYKYNCGDTPLTKHHVMVMPAANMYNAVMNDTNTTTGGYYNSKMRGVEVDGVFTPYAQGCGLYNALLVFQSVFGDALLTHREYLCNAVSSGKESAGAWYDSIIELPSEIMMYGTSIRTPTPRIAIDNKSQLALMQASPKFINTGWTYWLRDVVSSAYFARVNSNGLAYGADAYDSYGVRPVAAIGG